MGPKPIPTTEEGPPCVLDVGLSLAPTGLYWTLALARTVPVWLPQSHWSIIEDLNFFSRDARLLARLSGSHAGEPGDVVANTVAAWREARDALGFESTPRLYWHEGGRAGTVLPKDGDSGLIERVDALAAGFDGRRAPAGSDVAAIGVLDAMADCARDTAALAAALGGRHPLVLSPIATNEEVPELVRQLQAIGVASTRTAITEMLAGWQRPLLEALATSGLAVPVAAGRLRLAAIAVVAPRIHLLPQVGGCGMEEIDRLGWNDDGGAAEAALWDDASAIWWELLP
jgi:hypothetical protein